MKKIPQITEAEYDIIIQLAQMRLQNSYCRQLTGIHVQSRP